MRYSCVTVVGATLHIVHYLCSYTCGPRIGFDLLFQFEQLYPINQSRIKWV